MVVNSRSLDFGIFNNFPAGVHIYMYFHAIVCLLVYVYYAYFQSNANSCLIEYELLFAQQDAKDCLRQT